MYQVRETNEFAAWLLAVRDPRARAKIAVRIDRLAQGNSGDSKSVGDGVSEMRIDYGPGYRVYYTLAGQVIVLLLSGGTKKTQPRDIAAAKLMRRRLADEGSG